MKYFKISLLLCALCLLCGCAAERWSSVQLVERYDRLGEEPVKQKDVCQTKIGRE